MISFNEMNIGDDIKKAVEDLGFTQPTPIQEKVIPLILERRDVIEQAPTGTGKTCAFGIPVLCNIDGASDGIQALILCPTRELVVQTEAELKEVAKYSKALRILSIYGGQNIDRQLSGLRKKPQIIIGTTGRVMDHLRRKSLKIEGLKILVLDEVDEMLDMGFKEDIDVILQSAPPERQTILFSATMPKEIIEISKRYQKEPLSIKAQHEENDIPNILQHYVKTTEGEKIAALISIMRDKKYELTLVFCNTKNRVDELCTVLAAHEFSVDALHGDLRQHQRDKTMKKFRGGETQVLIATDVAARGLDVDNIEAIFNFDIPHDEEDYVHRIGRTGRANKTGDAYTFVTEKQMFAIKNFERFTKSVITKTEFSKGLIDKNIDAKLFERTLKLVKKGDLTQHKEFIDAEFIKFKEKNAAAELIDFAAALLLQLNELKASKESILSPPPKAATRIGGKRNLSGVKFFMNIGTRDKCDPESVIKFIASNTAIPADNILDVNCLENFSFATVQEGHNQDMDSLNGLKYNKRILAVEVADNSKGSNAKKEFKPFKEFKPSSYKSGKPYEKKDSYDDKKSTYKSKDSAYEGKKSTYGNKESAYRGKASTGDGTTPSYEKKTSAYGSKPSAYGDKKSSYDNKKSTSKSKYKDYPPKSGKPGNKPPAPFKGKKPFNRKQP